MIIDIRDLTCRWINLDTATENAKSMNDLCDSLSIGSHERFSARTLPSPEGTPPTEIHYRGVGQSHIDCLTSVRDQLPALVLEDDVEVSEDYSPLIEVPDNTDAIYLGISHGDGAYKAMDIGNGLAKISEVLAAHAVVYLTERYLDAVVSVANHCIHEIYRPFDIGTYGIQKDFMVVTPHRPYFYQKASPESLNNWEALTRHPLNIRPNGPVGDDIDHTNMQTLHNILNSQT
tara:strand:+ start:1076 stop:1771 length:696 start_codon:yes stop_codon:yes gene_type:complete